MLYVFISVCFLLFYLHCNLLTLQLFGMHERWISLSIKNNKSKNQWTKKYNAIFIFFYLGTQLKDDKQNLKFKEYCKNKEKNRRMTKMSIYNKPKVDNSMSISCRFKTKKEVYIQTFNENTFWVFPFFFFFIYLFQNIMSFFTSKDFF